MAEWKEDKLIKREEEEIVTFGWDEADVLL